MQLDRLRKVSDRVSVCMRPQNSPKRWVTGGLSACSMQPMIDMSNETRGGSQADQFWQALPARGQGALPGSEVCSRNETVHAWSIIWHY